MRRYDHRRVPAGFPPQQCLADALDDFGTGRVEVFHVTAEQDFARQTERPAIVSQLEALLLEYGDLRRGQALLRCRLATGHGQDGQQQNAANQRRENGRYERTSQLLV